MPSIISTWMTHTTDMVRCGGGRDQARNATDDAARTYAIVAIAMADAAHLAGSETVSIPPLLAKSVEPVADATHDAAAEAAAFTVLRALFTEPAIRKYLDGLYEKPEDGSEPLSSHQLGETVGKAILAARANDLTEANAEAPSGLGRFGRSWSNRYRRLRPFLLQELAALHAGPPPATDSARYRKDWEETKSVGRAGAELTSDQEVIRRIWSRGNGTSHETGIWINITGQVISGLETPQAARLMALVASTVANAMISSWETKHVYNTWRPEPAIQMAHAYGDPRMSPDLNWKSQAANPGGSPEYTSGTATFAGAASHILMEFFNGAVPPAFEVRDELRSAPVKTYSGKDAFKSAAKDAMESRILNGIHFRFANTAGFEAGVRIAKEIIRLHPFE